MLNCMVYTILNKENLMTGLIRYILSKERNVSMTQLILLSNFQAHLYSPNKNEPEMKASVPPTESIRPIPPSPETICRALNISSVTIDWLAGDGSDRCYYRISSSQLPHSYVLMALSGKDAELLKSHGYEWIHISDLLAQHKITVPSTVRALPEHAAIIIEDYGDIMMETAAYNALSRSEEQELDKLYMTSFIILKKFLAIPKNSHAFWCQRKFDQSRLEWELHFFKSKFLENHLKLKLSKSEQSALEKDIETISIFLSSFPTYFVHRDFHSRNLMIHNQDLAVLDFQDARLGPASYDLVSVCFDSYVDLSLTKRLDLLEHGINTLSSENNTLSKEIRSQWPAVLLHRQLKAIGSFAFLTNEKLRGNYLKYLQPALDTLSHEAIVDTRWPFLSSELIRKIKEYTN